MAPEDRVAAVVVAYDGGDDLLHCVESLLAQTVRGLEVIVVDNASTDGSIERAAAVFGPRIRILRRRRNGGYAAGANTGWRATEAPIVAILNQDLILEADCVQQMRHALVHQPRDALVSPKLVLMSDPTRVNALGNDVHVSGVTWCHGIGSPASQWHGVHEVTAISGAAFMTRRTVLEALDGLEESYFMYMEDVDLSFRARIEGAACLAACDAVAAHDWSLDLSPRKFALLERNRRGMWERFFNGSGRPWLALYQAEAMAWVYALIRGRGYLRAKWWAHRKPLALRRYPATSLAINPWLSWRHPYTILFPTSRFIAVVGAIADTFVTYGVSALRVAASLETALGQRGRSLRGYLRT